MPLLFLYCCKNSLVYFDSLIIIFFFFFNYYLCHEREKHAAPTHAYIKYSQSALGHANIERIMSKHDKNFHHRHCNSLHKLK